MTLSSPERDHEHPRADSRRSDDRYAVHLLELIRWCDFPFHIAKLLLFSQHISLFMAVAFSLRGDYDPLAAGCQLSSFMHLGPSTGASVHVHGSNDMCSLGKAPGRDHGVRELLSLSGPRGRHSAPPRSLLLT
jgi:hypothetical protein